MRNILLSVLTTVALVLVTVGPAAALQVASNVSTGYLTIGRVTSPAIISPRRQQDRGFDVVAQTFDIQKRRRDRLDECKGLVDSSLIPICKQRLNCYTSADLQFKRDMASSESCVTCLNEFGSDHGYCTAKCGISTPLLEGKLDAAQVLCDKTYPHPED